MRHPMRVARASSIVVNIVAKINLRAWPWQHMDSWQLHAYLLVTERLGGSHQQVDVTAVW
jgi:hypothetical protein